MKYGLEDNDLEVSIGSAAVGWGATCLGIVGVMSHLENAVSPDTVVTTAQLVEMIGVPALTGILGCAVGAALGRLALEHAAVLNAAVESVGKVMFDTLPHALGNGAGKAAVKVKQIAAALNQKAGQIAARIQTKFREAVKGEQDVNR